MARKKKSNTLISSFFALIIGAIIGFISSIYIKLPESYVIPTAVIAENSIASSGKIDADVIKSNDLSIHFLELGNKYTGDCTYIKVGENIDILIDCGSKSNSVETVSNYLNQYVTDGVLEYVIITHAHQDHYAGFATTTKVDSIFDLYECETIITFSTTNQKTPTLYLDSNNSTASEKISTLGIKSYGQTTSSTSTLYANFTRELQDELNTTLTKGSKAGQNPQHLLASDIVEANNGKIELDQTNDINLHILENYYYTNEGHENNYSVCTMLNQGDKYFIFTGDLEEDGEELLVDASVNPIFSSSVFTSGDYSVELYKAGHHGSKTSSSMDLLNVIRPKIVCVCCCAGSSEYSDNQANQFPTKQFINNISQFTTQVYVTTLCIDYKNDEFESFNGNIVIMATDKYSDIAVYCSNNTTVLKDTLWFKENRLEMCKQQEDKNPVLNSTWY